MALAGRRAFGTALGLLRQSRWERLLGTVRPTLKEISADGAAAEAGKAGPEKAVLIDVREDNEWERARIAGDNVVHLARGVLERDIERVVPDPQKPIIVYCAGGARSLLAAESLQRMGYTNVKSLAGGISDWAKRGLPVDAVPKKRT